MEAPRFLEEWDKIEAGALVADFVPGVTLPAEVKPGDGRYTRWVKLLLQNRTMNELALERVLSKLSTPVLETALAPETLTDPVAIRAAIVEIKGKLQLVPAVRLEVQDIIGDFEPKTRALAEDADIPEEYKNTLLHPLFIASNKAMPIWIAYVDLQEEALDNYRQILVFFLTRQDQFLYKNNELAFYSNTDTQQYNDLARRFSSLAQKERDLLRRVETLNTNRGSGPREVVK